MKIRSVPEQSGISSRIQIPGTTLCIEFHRGFSTGKSIHFSPRLYISDFNLPVLLRILVSARLQLSCNILLKTHTRIQLSEILVRLSGPLPKLALIVPLSMFHFIVVPPSQGIKFEVLGREKGTRLSSSCRQLWVGSNVCTLENELWVEWEAGWSLIDSNHFFCKGMKIFKFKVEKGKRLLT